MSHATQGPELNIPMNYFDDPAVRREMSFNNVWTARYALLTVGTELAEEFVAGSLIGSIENQPAYQEAQRALRDAEVHLAHIVTLSSGVEVDYGLDVDDPLIDITGLPIVD